MHYLSGAPVLCLLRNANLDFKGIKIYLAKKEIIWIIHHHQRAFHVVPTKHDPLGHNYPLLTCYLCVCDVQDKMHNRKSVIRSVILLSCCSTHLPNYDSFCEVN